MFCNYYRILVDSLNTAYGLRVTVKDPSLLLEGFCPVHGEPLDGPFRLLYKLTELPPDKGLPDNLFSTCKKCGAWKYFGGELSEGEVAFIQPACLRFMIARRARCTMADFRSRIPYLIERIAPSASSPTDWSESLKDFPDNLFGF